MSQDVSRPRMGPPGQQPQGEGAKNLARLPADIHDSLQKDQHFDLLSLPSHSPKIMENDLPVLIIGAGISGLLIAQQLRQLNVPFRIFERDDDFSTRGPGWGLTLHWSLPALRELLPNDLLARLPDTYVDRAAVERGECSTFPFFDLTTGERQGASPRAGEDERIRVTREGLRQLLATGIHVEVRY